MPTRSSARRLKLAAGVFSVLFSMLACSQGYVSPAELTATALAGGLVITTPAPTSTLPPPTLAASQTQELVATFTDLPQFTSTPRPTRTPDPNATPKPNILYYTQAGDTLPSILGRFGVTAEQVNPAEPIPQTGLINPGTLIIIPDVLTDVYDSIEVIPDSEVVFSPSAADFDIEAFVAQAGGYLSTYEEVVGSTRYTGAGLVKRVALENSINPYLLLTILEYKSHWVYGHPTNLAERDYPMGMVRLEYRRLYKQLSWTVSQLCIGYYGWRAGTLSILPFKDGTQVRVSPGLNAGTAAVQYLFAQWFDPLEWVGALYGDEGMPELMVEMFGDFRIRSESVDPLYPPDLQQPVLQLPFVPGRVWILSGGPHSAWGTDGALAALDFGPPSAQGGCVESNEWATAMAPGVVVRTGNGVVILDLDGDGIEQTGWSILYMHIEARDRVEVGTRLNTGDRIGHPSCEGGVSTGTHTHVARKFNGEWILADGPLSFNLSGWVAHNGEAAYKGYLTQGDQTVTADPLASPKANISIPRD